MYSVSYVAVNAVGLLAQVVADAFMSAQAKTSVQEKIDSIVLQPGHILYVESSAHDFGDGRGLVETTHVFDLELLNHEIMTPPKSASQVQDALQQQGAGFVEARVEPERGRRPMTAAEREAEAKPLKP